MKDISGELPARPRVEIVMRQRGAMSSYVTGRCAEDMTREELVRRLASDASQGADVYTVGGGHFTARLWHE